MPDYRIEIVPLGGTLQDALELARDIENGSGAELALRVRQVEPGDYDTSSLIGGAFCDECAGQMIAGLHWDHTSGLVRRCSTCERFPDDAVAARTIVGAYQGSAPVELTTRFGRDGRPSHWCVMLPEMASPSEG